MKCPILLTGTASFPQLNWDTNVAAAPHQPEKKQPRQKAQKQHRKMLQSFQFLLREEWLASYCERRKIKAEEKQTAQKCCK